MADWPAAIVPPAVQADRLSCPTCGQANRREAHYCAGCGASLAASAPARRRLALAAACGLGPALAADLAFAWLLGQRAPGVLGLLVAVSALIGVTVTWMYAGAPANAQARAVGKPSPSLSLSGGRGTVGGVGLAEAAPTEGVWWAVGGSVVAVLLAISGQAALLRTRAALPAIALFGAAAILGGWSARRWLRTRTLAMGDLPAPRGRTWLALGALALAANGAALALFGRDVRPNVAWLLFVGSMLAVGLCGWFMDGRPGLSWPGRAEWLHLLALLAVFATGAAVRLIWLDRVPFGVWFDEAYSSLQVQRIMADPGFRPVFLGAEAQAPAMFWYLAVPFFKLLGPVPLAMRLVNAIGGALSVLAIYAAGRQLFDRRVGLVGAGILACFTWHINFSRFVPNPAVWSVTLDALALALLVHGLRRRSWTSLVLCGAAMGLGQHMYYTSRVMLGVVALALLAAWLTSTRGRLAAGLRALLPLAVAGVICASPLILYARQHPVEFAARTATVSVLNEVRDKHSWQPVLDNLRAHLLMFNLQGDPNARHNIPGNPELNLILGGLAVLGLGMSLARAPRPEYLLLPVWGGAMLLGGVLTLSFEAPQSMRSIGETNVVALLAALPLAFGWQALRDLAAKAPRGGPVMASVAAVPVLGVVGLSGYLDVNRYFNVQMHDSRSFDEYSTVETFVARAANDLPRGTAIYMDSTLAGTPTIQFLSPWLKDGKVFSDATLPLRDPVDTALFLKEDEQLRLARNLYPSAQVKDFTAPYGGPQVLHEVVVSAAQVAALEGVQAEYTAPDAAPIQRKEPSLGLAALPAAPPLRATFQATLAAPAYGVYGFQLEGPAGAQLSLDRQPVASPGTAVDVKLARGNHRLDVTADFTSADQPLRLLWRPPKAAEWAPVPSDALFVDPVNDNGLLGKYYANDSWSGAPSIEQIDPAVAFSFHILPLPYPYSIDWTGQLAVPTAGLYRFGTTSIDSAQVLLDGTQVVDDHTPNDYTEGQLPLTAGLHAIEVRFEAHTGHNHVELFWQPPGQDRQIIPSAFLFPSRSAGEAVPLPQLPASPAPAAGASPLPMADAVALGATSQLDLAGVLGGDSKPGALAVDAAGNAYLADRGRHAVDKLDDGGQLLWSFGDKLVEPSAVAVEASGDVLALDAADGYISRLSPDGALLERLGGPALGLYRPRGLAVAPNGDIYVADTGGGRVVHLDSAGQKQSVLGDGGLLKQPTGVAALPGGEVMVVDGAAGKVALLAASGDLEREWTFSQTQTVDGPQLALAPDGSVWASDPSSGLLVRFDAGSQTPQVFRGAAELHGPSGIAAGPQGLMVVESEARSLDVLSPPA